MTILYRGAKVAPQPKTRLDRVLANFRGRRYTLANASRKASYKFRGREVTDARN